MSEQSPLKIQPTQPPPPTSNFNKYLQHFQSINTPIKLPPTFIRNNPSPNNPSSAKFGLALQMYSSSISTSIIDQIADSPVKDKESGVQLYEDEFQDFVYEPVLANFNPRVKERVTEINRFFAGAGIEHGGLHDDANLNGYVRNIISIDLKNAMTRHFEQSPMRNPNRSRSKESSKPPVVMPVISSTVIAGGVSNETRAQVKQETEVNAQPTQAQFAVSGSGKLKKIDLLLIQIMKQKKRKGLVSDYFRAIEMKLVELLEYILQDEPQYFGLSLKEKMKEVLQNLEGFKGKTVDGESKVNMLRIFFEEFRILKKEKDEEMERDNVSKSPSKKSQSKRSAGEKKNEQNKSKRNLDTQSMGGSHPQQKLPPKKKPASKSGKEEDQWMGSLNN